MEEIWKQIDEFPTYAVSNTGSVMNLNTEKILRMSQNKQGLVWVGLFRDGRQHSKLVRLLVADAFVDGKDDIFDTPINLDGYPENNYCTNLMWRPRWFAWKYSNQFNVMHDYYTKGPILELNTRDRYLDVYEAAVTNGLLFHGVWRSIHTRRPCFPTQQTFDIVR